MVASPRGDKKIIFRHEDLDGVNPYDPSDSFRSEDSLARESLWESGLYGEWTETTNAVLEPKVFRGEEVITRAILKQENPRQKSRLFHSRSRGKQSRIVNAEKGYSELRRLLEDRNFVSNIDLSVQENRRIQTPDHRRSQSHFSRQRSFVDQKFPQPKRWKSLVALDPTEAGS